MERKCGILLVTNKMFHTSLFDQLAFPKGLTSAPGRPRVAANSPVIFDVSLEYIPGLEDEEE